MGPLQRLRTLASGLFPGAGPSIEKARKAHDAAMTGAMGVAAHTAASLGKQRYEGILRVELGARAIASQLKLDGTASFGRELARTDATRLIGHIDMALASTAAPPTRATSRLLAGFRDDVTRGISLLDDAAVGNDRIIAHFNALDDAAHAASVKAGLSQFHRIPVLAS